MQLPADQLQELKELCPGVQHAEEGGKNYFLLPQLCLPDGTSPAVVDALLCISERDGYQSRLFFPKQIASGKTQNWNATSVPILGGTWFAYSWKTGTGLRPVQMVAEHLLAFR